MFYGKIIVKEKVEKIQKNVKKKMKNLSEYGKILLNCFSL